MNIILTSPPLDFDDITGWSRYLIGTSVMIDKSVPFEVSEILQFQAQPPGKDGAGWRLVVLVKLNGPRKQPQTAKEDANG